MIPLLASVSHPAKSETIPLERHSGTYMVPVRINQAITLPFTIDTGSADVAIPADVFSTLVRSGTVMPSDFIGAGVYRLADGSEQQSERFVLHEVGVGHFVVRNVIANVVPAKGDPLLGQSFLSQLPKWAIDNKMHVLVLDGGSRRAQGQEVTTRIAPTPQPQQVTPPNTSTDFNIWPPVGAWAVLLLPPSRDRSAGCTVMTRVPPYGPAGYSMAFDIGPITTHFSLASNGSVMPVTKEITLSVDGSQIATLSVIEQSQYQPRKSCILTDVPGNMLSEIIFPAMMDRTTLTVTVGRHNYLMPISHYKRVISEVFACADAFRAAYK